MLGDSIVHPHPAPSTILHLFAIPVLYNLPTNPPSRFSTPYQPTAIQTNHFFRTTIQTTPTDDETNFLGSRRIAASNFVFPRQFIDTHTRPAYFSSPHRFLMFLLSHSPRSRLAAALVAALSIPINMASALQRLSLWQACRP